MNTLRIRGGQSWIARVLLVLFLGFGFAQISVAAEYGLGDIPLDPEIYQKFLKEWPPQEEALPASYDARDEGIVTSPKNQGSCGSCWAFASVGAFESHLLKECSFGPTDLSEQQQNSCNVAMAGCCGGSSTALQFWETQGPIYESCFPYGDGGTSCPTYSIVPCAGAAGCEQLTPRVTNWHTLAEADFKNSLYYDGPSYWRYTVYSDFQTYWSTAGAGEVYVSQPGAVLRGGHAVLLIGWDDAAGAYLLKNSWGATGGPNGDGTFRMAYTGHYYDLNFGMANFNLTSCPSAPGTYELRADNTDPQHEQYGPWVEAKDKYAYGNNTFHYNAAGSGADYFRYVTPSGGEMEFGHYAIYARWPAKSVAATNTRYVVYPGVGSTDVRVNQTESNARWVKLGAFDITHPRPVVRVYDDADGYVVADGIRFVRIGPLATTAEVGGAEAPENSDELK